MKRKNIGRVAGVAAASLALGAMAQSALAAAPACGPGNNAQTFMAPSGAQPITDNNATGITSTINVTGKTGVVRDVDVKTLIQHKYNREVSIWISHGGKTVLLVKGTPTKRAGSNGFNGTVWDDSAPTTILEREADLAAIPSTPLATVVPEGALGAFVGSDPNGAWTLKVTDNADGDIGSLDGWSLDLATSASTTGTPSNVTGGGTGRIENGLTGTQQLTRTINVSGVQPYLTDLNLRTAIEHFDSPSELKIWLTSPANTKVLISGGRGDGSLTSLTTLWNDSAAELISQAQWSNATPATRNRDQLVPEGALAKFIGENPNGQWTLTIDDANVPTVDNPATPTVDESLQYGFELQAWSLELSAAAGCDPAAGGNNPLPPPVDLPAPPVVNTAPAQTVALPAPVCVKVGLGTKVLGATNIKKGKSGVVRVQLKNTGGASANKAAATFAIPSGFSITKKPAGATITKGKLTLPFGTIAAGQTKTVSLTLKAGAKASTGLRKSTVSASAACGSTGSGKLAVTIKKA